MNINITIDCETCGKPTNCRIGMSNREVQPFRFGCQSCGSPIDIVIRANEGSTFVGATQRIPDLMPFDAGTNFVDLHLDLPASFEPYFLSSVQYQLLTSYREMHRLHHLVKWLFYYRYLGPQ